LFPLAYAVVDAENNDNWLWFLQMVRRVIEGHTPDFLHPKKLTFLSDRQKGLLEAVENVFPDSPHGYCLKHLEECFRKAFKNADLCSLLWKAARATTQKDFDKAIQDMNGINPLAFQWLQANADPVHWAEIYFEGRRYSHLTSNISESLNSWLLRARELPILAMLETIRHQLMQWYANRRHLEDRTQGLVVAKIAKRIQDSANSRARRYRFLQSTDSKFEVQSKGVLNDYQVDINERSCSCREWRATGIPCSHALAVILGLKRDPQDYTERFYRLEEYKATYSGVIAHPLVNDVDQPLTFNFAEFSYNMEDGSEPEEDNEVLEPPNTRRPAGRPKKKRIRRIAGNEVPVHAFKCSRCEGLGHSRRTCTAAI
jgi:MULE transposase domain/SWIM zinc finger